MTRVALTVLRTIYRTRLVSSLAKQWFETRMPLSKLCAEDISQQLSAAIEQNAPLCAGKIGATERSILCWHLGLRARVYGGVRFTVPKFKDLISGMQNAGIFPFEERIYHQFAELMLATVQKVDLMAMLYSQSEISVMQHLKSKAVYGTEEIFMPFFLKNSWTRALHAKRVLVVSPFARSFEQQMLSQKKAWPHSIVPDFELHTLRYPYFFNGSSEYADIFAVYSDFSRRIEEAVRAHRSQVVILGCGALGLPLAVHAKSLGCQGIHMGGTTQLLFGIIGGRWENDLRFKHVINADWQRPQSDEVPETYRRVENGCYW